MSTVPARWLRCFSRNAAPSISACSCARSLAPLRALRALRSTWARRSSAAARRLSSSCRPASTSITTAATPSSRFQRRIGSACSGRCAGGRRFTCSVLPCASMASTPANASAQGPTLPRQASSWRSGHATSSTCS
ncbi:hypothetical protein G6F58_013505 [Rhizopus delemar]|nr:hypothetical protein G6F58_013505 [Rhizopus delemar]